MTRRSLIAAFVIGASCCLPAPGVQNLAVRLDGDYLRVSLPHIDFLQGKPLDRLKDGGSIAFIGQLTITTSPNSLSPVARAVARFAMSYDIWAENFSVTKIGQSPDSRRTISHLSAQAAETWCLENLGIDRSQVPPDKPFYVQLDLRVEDPKDQLAIIGEPGINISRLIEIFGRPSRGTQPRWLETSGPWHMDDLKKIEIKGVRG